LDCPDEVETVIVDAKAVSEPLSGAGESETLRRITVNIGTISGGVSPNLVPDTARAAADVRLPMGVSSARFMQHIHEALDPLPGITVRVIQKYDPSWTSPTEEIVKHVLGASREVAGPQAVVNMRVGASD
jgi:succinyl-diaminopimelate desuccinylase